MKKSNNTLFKYWSLEPKEAILSIVFLISLIALVYFSMWGAHALGLLDN